MFIRPKTPEKIEKRRRFWRRARRFTLWSLAIGFVLHSALNIYASTLLGRELRAIRQKGQPLQFAELAPPAVPDSQNAAPIYKQAKTALRFSPSARIALATRESAQTPQMKRDIEIGLKENRRALDLTRRAAAMPRCVFPLNYRTANPTALLFPYYAEMRELARTLAMEAKSKARRGDRVGALRDVRAIFGMAHHLSNEPALIGYLVASAVDTIADRALAQVLESARFTAAELEAFKVSLPKTTWNRAFRRTMMGERSWGVPAFENLTSLQSLMSWIMTNTTPDSDKGMPPRWIIVPLFLLWRPFLRLDEVHTLRLWHLVIDSPEMQRVPLPPGPNIVEREIERLPRYAMLTQILMPVFSRANFNRDRNEVRRRQREVALAIAAYRGAEGSLPEKLETVSAVKSNAGLLDPYSQKPFVYRLDKNGKTFTLYSIGPNRKDDGGASYSSAGTNWNNVDDDDIIWGRPKRGTS